MPRFTLFSKNYATGEGAQHCLMYCNSLNKEEATELFRKKFGWPHYKIADVYDGYVTDNEDINFLLSDRIKKLLTRDDGVIEYYCELYVNYS